MALDWQDVAAVAIVLSACGYLLHAAQCVLFSRRQRACGGCAGCAADSKSPGDGFVPLSAIAQETGAKR